MLHALPELLRRRAGRVLLAVTLALPILAAFGGRVEQHLSVGGFVADGLESTRAVDYLDETFGTAAPNYVIVAETDGSISAPAPTAAGLAVVAAVQATPGVLDVVSPWTLGALPPGVPNPLVSDDGDSGVLAVRLGGDEDAQRATAERLDDIVEAGDTGTIVAVGDTGNIVAVGDTGSAAPLDLVATGPAEVARQAAETAKGDLVRAELIAAPLTFAGLVLVFRGAKAALIPLAVAVVAILSTYAVLRAVAAFTPVSVFSLNLTTGLGIGLAIDYSLLLVARFREERSQGSDVADAVADTVASAGRTVAISAATVGLSLLALLVFPVVYLRSFAYAGIAVVASAAFAAVVVVPAVLMRFGHHLGSEVAVRSVHGGFWADQARRVMRRPVLWALAAIGVLAVAGAPFLGVRGGRIDDRYLPEGASARTGAEILDAEFDAAQFSPVTVATPWLSPTDTAALAAFVDEVLAVPSVARVDSALGFSVAAEGAATLTIPPTDYNDRFVSPAGPGAGTWVNVTLSVLPDTDAADATVAAIRAIDERAMVGGVTAATVDAVDLVDDRLPLALGAIAVTTAVLLFLMTGSVLVPVKALVLNVLSLSATFGALVWVFQEGHLAGVLGITPTGRLDVFTPLLMFCVAFGLSMDYEIFLLARIKERYDATADGAAAIADGLGHTGRTVTAAAGLLAIVCLAIGTSGVASVKMLGLGLAIAVLVDAFVVRATLVPAVMYLAGAANWWAPSALERLHLRFGIREAPARGPRTAHVTPTYERTLR